MSSLLLLISHWYCKCSPLQYGSAAHSPLILTDFPHSSLAQVGAWVRCIDDDKNKTLQALCRDHEERCTPVAFASISANRAEKSGYVPA